MPDFLIRPATDTNWQNSVALSGNLPLSNNDASALGIPFGVLHEIARLSDTTDTFTVAEPVIPPGDLGNNPTIALDQNVLMTERDMAALLFSGDGLTITLDGSSPALPAGLSLSSVGTLSGTPTVLGTTALTFLATNSAGSATATATITVNAVSGGDGIAIPDPVVLVSASETQIVVTLPADPVATNRTINDRVLSLVPLAAYTGNEQNPSAWTAGGAQWIALQPAGATITFNGSYSGNYVVVWEARDTTTDPRTDSDWSVGTAANVVVSTDPPVVDSISISGSTITSNITDTDSTSVTAVWATADAAEDPTYTVGGGWVGTTYETGTFAVTEGGDTDTITLTATTPAGAREISLYYYDADDNLTGVQRLAFDMPSEAAPTVSNVTGTQTGETTADWGADTTEAGGTMYAAAYPDGGSVPAASEVIAGTGGGIVAADSLTPSIGTNSGSFTGLTGNTAYRVAVVHVDADTNESNVATSAAFTTAAPSGIQAPVRLLTTPYADSVNPTTTHTTTSVTPTGGRPLMVIVHAVTNTSSPTLGAATFTFGGNAFDETFFRNQGQTTLYIGVVNNPATTAQAAVFSPDGSGTRGVVIEIIEIPGASTTDAVGADAVGLGTGAATITLTTTTADALALYVGSRTYEATGIAWTGVDASLTTSDSGDTNGFQDITGAIAWEAAPTAGSYDATTNAPAESKTSALLALEVKAA